MENGLFSSLLIFSLVFSGPGSAFLNFTQIALAQTDPLPGETVEQRKVRLEAELVQTEKEIASWQGVLKQKQRETASLARDAAILNAKVQEAKLVIRARNLAIEQLGKDIGEKEKTISTLQEQIDRSKKSISQLIKKTNEADAYSMVEMALSNDNLSSFFTDFDSFDSINISLRQSIENIQGVKREQESQKEILNTKKGQEADAKAVIEAEKRQVEKNEAEKQRLIQINRTQEKSYAQVIAEREKKAAQIRATLFALRDTAAIPFGTALQYANEASQKTGVRPAFLLAILTQESNLGENVGQCFVTNFTNGDGVGKNTGRVFTGIMKPSRDIAPFLKLAEKLGFDPKGQPVSCPQPGGYGGAMGPSQFLPSTWTLYENKIASALGVSVPNPWMPRDAFMASAIYLAELGASTGGYTAEATAAAKYYAGSAWRTRGQTYATNVMGHARNIQENMIDPLQGV